MEDCTPRSCLTLTMTGVRAATGLGGPSPCFNSFLNCKSKCACHHINLTHLPRCKPHLPRCMLQTAVRGTLIQVPPSCCRSDEGLMPPLPNFTAIVNPHDRPYQEARLNWCGLVPLLSNSRIAGSYRDLMMPDFSFAPLRSHLDSLSPHASEGPRL